MAIEIDEDWFNNNISGETGYTLDSENEIFTKTILEDDLTFEFANDTDGEFFRKFVQSFCSFEFSDIILSHTVPVTSTGFAISDTTSIRSV